MHVLEVEPDLTPLGQLMLVHATPCAAAPHEPEPRLGVLIALHPMGARQARADQRPSLQVRVSDPEVTPYVQDWVQDAVFAVVPHTPDPCTGAEIEPQPLAERQDSSDQVASSQMRVSEPELNP